LRISNCEIQIRNQMRKNCFGSGDSALLRSQSASMRPQPSLTVGLAHRLLLRALTAGPKSALRNFSKNEL
jgi:hypothetical protein